MSQELEHIPPWYKQFWAWFIFSPLIIVVIACSVMVTIAFKTKDDMVVDDYYKVGRLINQEFGPAQVAKELGLVAELRFDPDGRAIVITLNESDWPEQSSLLLNFSHPVDAEKDHFITLKRIAPLTWRSALKKPVEGRWYARLFSLDDVGGEEWRVQSEISLSDSTVFQLN